jgi:hypothetical protein
MIIVASLYFARELLIPFVLSLLLCFVLAPVVIRLRRSGLGRVPAVAVTVVIAMGLVGSLGTYFVVQLFDVTMRLPEYQVNIEKKIDILAHVRCCADVWGETIDRMLAGDEPTLPYRHPNDCMKEYANGPFDSSLAAFEVQRGRLLSKLAELTAEEWRQGAEIKGRRHTVFSQVRRMALHEVGHWGEGSKGQVSKRQGSKLARGN